MFIFKFNFVFILNFLKMAFVRVRFGPGRLPGAGYSAEHDFCGFSKRK
jgi:hypothetical protein